MLRSLTRLGFACNWDPDRTRTWSGTNWALMTALQTHVDTVDVGTHMSLPARRAWQLATRRRRNGSWVSTWETTPQWEKYLRADVQKRVTATHCDAVLEIQDVGILDRPFFIYQDLSYDVLVRELESGDEGVSHFFKSLDRDVINRRRARQHEVFARATGVMAMSGSKFSRMTMAVPWVTAAMTPSTQPKQWNRGTVRQSRSSSVTRWFSPIQ